MGGREQNQAAQIGLPRVTARPGHENVGAAVGHERTMGHD